jgi:uncharacterized membrane protein
METLPVPADTFRSDTHSIDPTGRYIVGEVIVRKAGEDRFVIPLWDNGRLGILDVKLPNAAAVEVNRDGVVIGNAIKDSLTHPWRHQAGVTMQLPLPDGVVQASVSGINAHGDIVGLGVTPANTAQALLWPGTRPDTVRVIEAPSDLFRVQGVIDDGTVVGLAGDPFAPVSWLRTPAGAVHILTSPDGDTQTHVAAVGGNWAVGQGRLFGETVGLRWDLNTRSAAKLDPQLGINPNDVNAHGVVLAGEMLQRGRTVVKLPSPAPNQPIGGRAIADDDTVVGFHNTRSIGVRAVRWTGC